MSHNPVKEVLSAISADVWKSIQQKKSLGLTPSEESITDERVIVPLHDIPSKYLTTKLYNKRQEGLNGADWEWVFLSKERDKCFSIRVQAKVLNPNDLVYHELHYKKKNGRYQSDVLIEEAKKSNALPLYCLYNYFENIEKDDLWTCHCNYSAYDYYGCTLIDAAKVRAFRADNRKSLDDLKSYMLPMHCAITCKMDNSLSLPERVRQYWNVVMGNERPPEKEKERDDGVSYDMPLDIDSKRSFKKQDTIDFLFKTDSDLNIPGDIVDPITRVNSSIPPVISEIPEHIQHILSGEEKLVDAEKLNLKAVTIFFDE